VDLPQACQELRQAQGKALNLSNEGGTPPSTFFSWVSKTLFPANLLTPQQPQEDGCDPVQTLVSGKIDDAEKAKELTKKYDIDVSDTIFEEAKRMGALAEEMEIVREEGREEGRVSRDAELADYYAAEILRKKDETGHPVEKILSETIVPPELLDLILNRISDFQKS
jgi:hypothetical protein